jgi:hypothetical protein
MTDSPEIQLEQNPIPEGVWDKDKAETLGWLLHEHPDFIAAQAEQAAVIEELVTKSQHDDQAMQERMDRLNLGSTDRETLDARLNALQHRKTAVFFESQVAVIETKRKQAPELVEKSNQILQIAEEVYESDPEFYLTAETQDLMKDVRTIEECEIRLSELERPLTILSDVLGMTGIWEEERICIDEHNVTTVKLQVATAIKYAFGEDCEYIHELNSDYDEIIAGRYSRFTPATFISAVHRTTNKWIAKVLDIKFEQQETRQAILNPTPIGS